VKVDALRVTLLKEVGNKIEEGTLERSWKTDPGYMEPAPYHEENNLGTSQSLKATADTVNLTTILTGCSPGSYTTTSKSSSTGYMRGLRYSNVTFHLIENRAENALRISTLNQVQLIELWRGTPPITARHTTGHSDIRLGTIEL